MFEAPERGGNALTNVIEKEPLHEIKCVIPFAPAFLQQFLPQKNTELAVCGILVQPPVIELGVGILFLHPREKYLFALIVQLFELARDKVQGFPLDIALVVCKGHVMG